MNVHKNLFIHRIVRETSFYILLALLSVFSYICHSQRISVGPLRPHFFELFFYSSVIAFSFLLIGRLWSLVRPFIPDKGKSIIRESWIPIALILFSLYRFGGMFEGEFPSECDHTTQMLRCQLTEQALWNHGTVLPWTSAIGAGVPLNDLYPTGGALLYCLIRLLTGFLLSPAAAYITASFAGWFVLLGGLYACGRSLFGVAGGGLAAGLMAISAGDISQGGWNQAFHLGMWVTSICGGCVFVTLVFHGLTIEREAKRWQMAVLTASTATAILAHPFGFLALLVSLPIISVASVLHCEDRQARIRSVLRNSVFICLGILIAGWWLFPFLSSSSWVQPFGAPYLTEYGFAVDLVESKTFNHTPPAINALVLMGILWGVFSRRTIPTAFAAIAILGLLLCRYTWMECFFSKTYFSILSSVPLVRFYFLSKILGFALVGGMSQKTLANCIPAFASIRSYACAEVITKTCASSFFGFVRSFVRSLGVILALTVVYSTVRDVIEYSQRLYSFEKEIPIHGYPNHPPYAKNFERAMKQLQSLDPGPGEDTFLRPLSYPKIGVQTNLVESSIPYRFGYGIVTPYYTPTMLLTTRSANGDDFADRLSGRKYMLALTQSEGYFLQQPGANVIDRIGDVSIVKYDRYSAIPVQILHDPNGRCEIAVNEPNRLGIRLIGLSEERWIRVGVSRYRKWRAFQDGCELEICERIEAGEANDAGRYISVKANNGLLELRYAPQLIDWIAYIASALSFLAAVVFLVYKKAYQCISLDSRIFSRILNLVSTRKFQNFAAGAACIAAIALIAFAYSYASPKKTQFWYGGIVTDAVSPFQWKPDGILDIGFGLAIGKDLEGKTLRSVSLREINPEPLYPSPHRWTTGMEDLWKAALRPIGENKGLWTRNGQPLNIKLHPPHYVTIYVSNPHRGAYIPEKAEIELTLHFDSGESASYRSPLMQQGTH